MYVKEKYRNLGYSKILNNAILEEAYNRGFDKLYLKSTLNNYYEKFGAINNYYEKFGAIFMEQIDDEKLYYIKTKRR